MTDERDEKPELSDDWFEQADAYVGDKLVRPGRIGKQQCSCGHPSCKRWELTGIGNFYQGTGFEEEDIDWIVEALNVCKLTKCLPEGWFVYAMGEQVKPQIYAGDKHEHIGFFAELQHRDGGRLTKAEGATLSEALDKAAQAVHLQEAARGSFENVEASGNIGSSRSIKHSYTAETKGNWVD